MDRGRLEIEVALFAKNSDITEELTRLDNHIRNFSRAIKKKGEVGKKLDFVAQDWLARIIQHETDHMDGIAFPERLDILSREDKMREWQEVRERLRQASAQDTQTA